MNSVIIIGKIKGKPIEKETQTYCNEYHLLVETEKNFRNEDGSIELQTYDCILWKGMADTILHVCSEGTLVAIRGRLQPTCDFKAEIVAEKVELLK